MPENDGYFTEIMQEWTNVVASLWVAIGKPIDSQRLSLYCREFSQVPLGLLEKSIKRLMHETVYQVIPTIGEIQRVINKELHEANCVDYSDWVAREWLKVITKL